MKVVSGPAAAVNDGLDPLPHQVLALGDIGRVADRGRVFVVPGRTPHVTDRRQGAALGHRDELARRVHLPVARSHRQRRVELRRIPGPVRERRPLHPSGLGHAEDGRQVPHRMRAHERRVLHRGHLPADGQHVPRSRVRPGPEMVVAEHELLRQPRVVRDHGIVVDLHRQPRVVPHRVVHPRVPVVRLVKVRWRGQQPPVVRDRSTPRRHRRKIEVGRLVLLQEHHHPMTHNRHRAHPVFRVAGRVRSSQPLPPERTPNCSRPCATPTGASASTLAAGRPACRLGPRPRDGVLWTPTLRNLSEVM